MATIDRFHFPRTWWSWPFIALFAPHGGHVSVDDDRLRVRFGLLGQCDVPYELIASVGRMNWPWWAGTGVRISRGVVSFAARAGDAVVVEFREPVRVRAPFAWPARKIVLAVDQPARLAAAIAAITETTISEE